MKQFFAGTIRRIVMLVVFLAALPPLAILLASGLYGYKEANADAERRSLRTVTSIAERQQAVTENTLAILTALYRVSTLKSSSDSFSDAAFHGLVDEYSQFNNIFIMSASGQVLDSGLPGQAGRSLADTELYQRALASDEIQAAAYGLSPFSGLPVMQLLMPLSDRRDQVYAYLGAELHLSFFSTVFAGQPIPEQGVACLLSDKGLLALSSGPAAAAGQGEYIGDALWRPLQHAIGEAGVFQYADAPGRTNIAAYRRMHLLGSRQSYLYAVLIVPKSVADAPPAAMLRRDMLLLALAAACALLLGALLCHRGFVLPIRALLDVAGRLGRGELRARVRGHKHLHGEFAELNDEFYAMAETIEQRSAELEEERRAATRSSQAKSDFLANMSHEIRTPMNAILGMTHLVGKTPLQETQQIQVDKIRDASEDLLRLINNILDFSKIEAGKMRVERIPFHLGKLLNAVRGSGAERAKADGIRLVSMIAPDVPSLLTGDPSRLAQALSILLHEAMRYCKGNPVELGCFAENNTGEAVTLHFTKTVRGTRLEQDVLEHIRRGLEGRSEGVAHLDSAELGLMLAGKVLHLLEGTASAQNLVDGFRLSGIVRIVLPASEDRDESLLFDGERILVAGGGESVRGALKLLLERCNLQVDVEPDFIRTGQMLVEAERKGEAYAAVVAELPLELPESVRLVSDLKRTPGLTAQPKLILTGLQQEDNVPSEFFTAGLDAFLSRPINESLLVDVLSGLLAGKQENGRSDTGAAVEEFRFPGLKVLLVEDNAVNREIAREVLQNAGIAVSEAQNGIEAVAALDERPEGCDMVLMDLEMPGMDGLTATRKLRDSFSRWRLPIIAMTAHSGADEVAACLEAGMNDYTTKPLALRSLFGTISRWLPVAEADKAAATTLLWQMKNVLERSHARDPELPPLLAALTPLVHKGRAEALQTCLDSQDVKAALAMLDEFLLPVSP